MFARATLLEIDTVRMNLNTALERVTERVLPALRTRPGYQGVSARRRPPATGCCSPYGSARRRRKLG